MLGFIIKFILYYKQYFVLDCKIGMHYIYIHRYTINYNKVREARLISPRFRFSLNKILFIFQIWSSKSLFQHVSVTPAITLSQEDIFRSYKRLKVETLSVLLATQGSYQQTTFVAGEGMGQGEMKDRMYTGGQIHNDRPGFSPCVIY